MGDLNFTPRHVPADQNSCLARDSCHTSARSFGNIDVSHTDDTLFLPNIDVARALRIRRSRLLRCEIVEKEIKSKLGWLTQPSCYVLS